MDFIAEWQDASTNGARLDQEFILQKFGSHLALSVHFDRDAVDYRDFELAIVTWQFDEAHVSLCRGLSHHYIGRLHMHIRILERTVMLGEGSGPRRSLFAMGDEGGTGVACFCSREEGAVLVPDPEYISSFGYAFERLEYVRAPSWHERKNQAYFRGTDSGVTMHKDRLQAPRVATALRVRSSSMFDVRITGVEENRKDAEISKKEYDSLGIFGERESQTRILEYKYQIDIDGNSNAWTAFFRKLLSGSPVLKLRSPYRQWYYQKLIPWIHYAPVNNDGSDIETKLSILLDSESIAFDIGRRAFDFASSMDYEKEMTEAAAKVLRFATS